MADIKTAIKNSLDNLLVQLTLVEKVKVYNSTDAAIKDAEKLVFNNSAIAIGDAVSEKEFYSVGYDKDRIKVTILFYIKSSEASSYSEENIRIIKEGLRNNPLGLSSVATSNLSYSSEPINLTDRIKYFELRYQILKIESVIQSDTEIEDYLRNATGLVAGNVLTATGDSTFDFLPPEIANSEIPPKIADKVLSNDGENLFWVDKDTEQIINAKGDLIVGDVNAEPVRLPIGSPGYFMVVDPLQDRGYKFSNEFDGGTF